MSSKGENDELSKERAGWSGYSVLRQPLSPTWSSDVDPNFDAPTSLDDKNSDSKRWLDRKDWYGDDRNTKGRWQKPEAEQTNPNAPTKISSSYSAPKQRMDEMEQTVNMQQRTMETLDYAAVLRGLSEECTTAPARRIVYSSLQSRSSDSVPTTKTSKKSKSASKNDDDDDSNVLNMGLTAKNLHGVHARYAAVREMNRLISPGMPPVWSRPLSRKKSFSSKVIMVPAPPIKGEPLDLQPIFDLVDEGRVLEGPEILEVSTILDTLEELRKWGLLLENVRKDEDDDTTNDNPQNVAEEEDQGVGSASAAASSGFVELPKFCRAISFDPELHTLLRDAFDDDGRLSGTTFPAIGTLRLRVRTMKRDILDSLDSLLTTSDVQSKLSLESGGAMYSEVNGRIVIPISASYKTSSVGIVHDVSRSGKTAYVEPTAIVGPTNDMRAAEAELRAEENRVWRLLTERIVEHRVDIERSVAAAAHLDLASARIRLGQRLSESDGGGATIPQVGESGILSLRDAKHPVLLLRGLDRVVGSDIDLGHGNNQALVLTGPNSGGKTIILKLMGLVALMVRDGIPIPASDDGTARVDYFDPILADIGDLQSVDGDLSTFSGHMLVCREVLALSKRNALILMDEVGSGTDPAQGVAIAQALLEQMLTKGCRVGITTHFFPLKQLAASDDRFDVGAMQFINGRPTYKLLPGAVGESYALAVAERLGLPSSVLERANELLDSDTRKMGELIREMEDQKASVDQMAVELEEKRDEMKRSELEMAKDRQKLEQKQLNARREEAKKFAQKLEEKERVLEQVLERLKSDPSRKLVAKSWDDIRYVKRDALMEAEQVPSVLKKMQEQAESEQKLMEQMVPLSEMREKPELNEGDILIVCKEGSFLGKEGTVQRRVGRNKVELALGNGIVTMKLTDVALPADASSSSSSSAATMRKHQKQKQDENMSEAMRLAIQDNEIGGGTTRPRSSDKGNSYDADTMAGSSSNDRVFRLDANTVDVRGCNLEEAKRLCTAKFSRMAVQKRPVVFILHGHGTGGVLKKKIRDWLVRDKEWIKKWKPADRVDGGDAYTQVEVKSIEF